MLAFNGFQCRRSGCVTFLNNLTVCLKDAEQKMLTGAVGAVCYSSSRSVPSSFRSTRWHRCPGRFLCGWTGDGSAAKRRAPGCVTDCMDHMDYNYRNRGSVQNRGFFSYTDLLSDYKICHVPSSLERVFLLICEMLFGSSIHLIGMKRLSYLLSIKLPRFCPSVCYFTYDQTTIIFLSTHYLENLLFIR